MSEQLRRTVVRAAIPLLGEFETLTTAQIARAAGVDEADLLAVFADKEAILRACVAAMTDALATVLDPAGEVREIEAIGMDQPLATRLVKVIDILDAYNRRVRAGLDELLATSNTPRTTGARDELQTFGKSPEIRQAVTRLLEPEGQRLRLPARVLAEAFLGMTFGGVRPTRPDQPPLPAEQVVDVFLHGALSTSDDFTATLPRKRIGAGVLLCDPQGRVLLVEPTYKADWEIPGGAVEADESPYAAAVRELNEELGVATPVGRLLVVDWVPPRPGRTEGLMMVFDGGVLTAEQTARITLPADELRSCAWCTGQEAAERLSELLARRVTAAVRAHADNTVAYLENGFA